MLIRTGRILRPFVVAAVLACPPAVAATGQAGPATDPQSEELAGPEAQPLAETLAEPTEIILTVRSGDTLAELLDGAGIESAEAHAALSALAKVFPPRDLRPGHEIALQVDPERDGALLALEMEPQPGRTITVRRTGDTWAAEERLAPRRRHLVRAEGKVEGGLFPAMTAAGVPGSLGISLIRALAHQVDFQRDLQPGDSFVILFERFRDPDGSLLGHGRILHATLTLSGRRIAIWRHEAADGAADWYDENGRSLRRTFLRTPLDGARVSSRFGMRRHPVLGYSRMHRGMDFAAPTGTPVYAAADGTVLSVRTERGYGKIVRLRHRNGTETRYAHLSRFARGMKAGRRVKQGDIIGSVGSTGMSTGPHLHYEVVVAGRPVNPATKIEQTRRLAGRELAAFQAMRRHMDRQLAALANRTEMAMAED